MASKKTTKSKTTAKKTVSPSKKTTKKVSLKKVSPNTAKVEEKKSKRKMKKVITVFIIVFIAVTLFSSKGIFVVATVNGTPIYRWDVINRLQKLGGQQVVDELIQDKLIEQEALDKGIVIDEEAVNKEVELAKAASEAQGVPLEVALEQANLTMEDYINNTRVQQTVRAILVDEIAVADEEVETTFAQYGTDASFEGLTDDQIKLEIRKGLEEQKLQERAVIWLQEIRDSATVVTIVEF